MTMPMGAFSTTANATAAVMQVATFDGSGGAMVGAISTGTGLGLALRGFDDPTVNLALSIISVATDIWNWQPCD